MAPPGPPRAGARQVLLSQPAGARSDPDRLPPTPGQRARLNITGEGVRERGHDPAPRPQPSPCSLRRRAARDGAEPPAPGGGTHLPATARRPRARTVEQRGGFARTPVLVVVAVAAGPGHLLGDVGHAGRRRRQLLRRACPAARSCDRRHRITWLSGRPGTPRGTMGVVVLAGPRARSGGGVGQDGTRPDGMGRTPVAVAREAVRPLRGFVPCTPSRQHGPADSGNTGLLERPEPTLLQLSRHRIPQSGRSGASTLRLNPLEQHSSAQSPARPRSPAGRSSARHRRRQVPQRWLTPVTGCPVLRFPCSDSGAGNEQRHPLRLPVPSRSCPAVSGTERCSE